MSLREKVLVTGGAGYVGSILVPALLQQDYEVTLLDIFKWGVQPILHFAHDPKLTIVKGDVRDEAVVRQEVERADWVLHLAAVVGYPACTTDPILARTTNVDGTANVCKAMRAGQKLIFASTGSTYGKVKGICTEETPINPLSLYGLTKWEAEEMVSDVGGVNLRFATVFGLSPRLRLDLLVNDFVYKALHDKQIVLYEGHFRRTFLHVRDVADSYVLTMKNFDKMRGEKFNIGDESLRYAKRDVALHVRKFVDYYLHEADVGKDVDARDYEVSYAKIRRLGYKAKVGLDEGIEELIKVEKDIVIVDPWRNA